MYNTLQSLATAVHVSSVVTGPTHPAMYLPADVDRTGVRAEASCRKLDFQELDHPNDYGWQRDCAS